MQLMISAKSRFSFQGTNGTFEVASVRSPVLSVLFLLRTFLVTHSKGFHFFILTLSQIPSSCHDLERKEIGSITIRITFIILDPIDRHVKRFSDFSVIEIRLAFTRHEQTYIT